jgi:hypothetical protein
MFLLQLITCAVFADNLKIENVAVTPRDKTTVLVKFDVSWEKSWRRDTLHDAAWTFFKTRANDKAEWQPARLLADRTLNPSGYARGEGDAADLVVPMGDDGHVGLFIRRAADGSGSFAAKGVAVILETSNTDIRAFGVEMVYVAEGAYCLGSGGKDLNRFHRYVPQSQDEQDAEVPLPTPPYLVASAGAIPTGRQAGKLWAVGIAPEDNGELPASFPNGYAAYYCMKHYYITQNQYAGFLNTLTPEQVKKRWYARGQGRAIKRSGDAPNAVFKATKGEGLTPWLSWEDCLYFAAWAGLRPITELEYEKSTRGMIYPKRGDASLSYWGLPAVNQGGIYERVVSAGSVAGRRFAGSHGKGVVALPSDWPNARNGVVYRGDYLKNRPYCGIGHLCTSGRSMDNLASSDRRNEASIFAGWRGARTAPAGDTGTTPVVGGLNLPKRTVTRLAKPAQIDGVLDEWKDPIATLDKADYVFPVQTRFDGTPWQGGIDPCVKLYLGWDGEALCVAAEVTDDKQMNTQSGGNIWNGDAVQMGLVNAEGESFYLAMALTTNGVVFHQFAGRNNDVLLKTIDCAVVRDDKCAVTRYELCMPGSAIGLKPGAEFGFCAMVFDGDDEKGQRWWMQMGPGIDYPFRPEIYPRFGLK